MIHHIAIGTPNVRELADFYLKIPNSKFYGEFYEENGNLRSVWIEFSNLILMIESGVKMAPRALIFQYEANRKQDWLKILEATSVSNKTNSTKYFLDPDGNQTGVSSFPETLPI